MKQPLVVRLAVSVLLAGSLAAPAAHAQMDSRDAIALQNQILELRHQLQVMQDQMASGALAPRGGPDGGYPGYGGGRQSPAGNDLVPQLLSRVQGLEEEVRRLRGQLDDLQNTSQREYQDLDKQLGDLKFRLGQPGGTGGLAAPGPASAPSAAPPPSSLAATPGYAEPVSPAYSPPGSGTPAYVPGYPYTPQSYTPPVYGAPVPSPSTSSLGTVPAAPPTATRGAATTPAPSGGASPAAAAAPRAPERAIQEGYADLARRDYAAAEVAAKEVLQNNRTSPRAYDAQFLLARALEGKRDYAQAAIAFDDTYNRSRTGTHAQDALLGLASSLNAIGEKRAACETLAKISREFPNARPDDVRNLRTRYACS